MAAGVVIPAIIADAGDAAVKRFLEFFAATIRNRNTRVACCMRSAKFFTWCDRHRLGQLADIEPLHVAAYIEALGKDFEKPTVKQHLAAIRMLFDWLVTGQVVATNPAHAVRGPKHVVKTGKTTVLDAEQARRLLDSIDISTVVGLRDRALISVMTFAFARIGTAVAMRVEDYYPKGKRWWVRLHEKGGKRHEMPAHHNLEAYLDSYMEAAGISDGAKAPLPFRRRSHWHAHRKTREPDRCLAHDPAPGSGAWHEGPDRLSYIPGYRDHGLPRSRWHTGECPGHGRTRKPTDDKALRLDWRRDHAR